MVIINIDNLLPEDTYMSTLNMDASNVPPSPEPPDGGAPTAQPARSPPPQRSPPFPDQNFIATEVISEAAATTPEGITNWMTEMTATFKYLLTNQAKHRLLSMTDLILFMEMGTNSTRFQIVHSITDLFCTSRSNNEDIEGQAVGSVV